MKAKLFLFTFFIFCWAVIIFFAPHSVARDYGDGCTSNCVDAAGLRQGAWQFTAQMLGRDEFNNPGKVIKKGEYLDSKPIGLWEEYNIDGTITEWFYDDTSDSATAMCFYLGETRDLVYETHYKGNIHEGPARIFYPKGGDLAMELTWSDGRINGPMKTYYPSGKLCEEGYWVENYWAYGGYTLYNEQGKVIRETPLATIVVPEGYDYSSINGR